MTDDLPNPLVPPDCDLRAYKDMPLEAATLRDARIVDVTSGDEFKAAILLWAAAWHQIPAGSLPDDEVQLAKYAGFGRVLREWRKVRDGALYGFVKCADGRLYHRFLCAKALVAWDSRREHVWRRDCDRIRKENKQRADQGEPTQPFPPKPPKLATDRQDYSNGNGDISAGKVPISSGTPDSFPAENALKGREVKGSEGNLIPLLRNGQASPAPAVKVEKPNKADPWAEVYAKGREILGDSSGGTITQLRKVLGDKPNRVLGKLHDAADKLKPADWLYAFMRENAPPGTHITSGIYP